MNTPITTIYSLTLTDRQGCSAKANLDVRIVHNLEIYLPTVFSPNGDGINDLWLPIPAEGKTYEIISLQIFDRWGGLHFKSKGIAGEVGWDGYSSGKLLDPGVYVFDLLLELADGQQHQLSGEIQLVR